MPIMSNNTLEFSCATTQGLIRPCHPLKPTLLPITSRESGSLLLRTMGGIFAHFRFSLLAQKDHFGISCHFYIERSGLCIAVVKFPWVFFIREPFFLREKQIG